MEQQLHMKNKSLEERYYDVIDDNVNGGKTNPVNEFFLMLAGVGIFCLFVYFIAGFVTNISIDRMSNKTQLKIEKILSVSKPYAEDKLSNKNQMLEDIRNKIVSIDKNLQGKSKFPIYIVENKDINAFVTADGSIYFTTGMLEKINDKEALTFVLAHELGHYAHRDHLKSIGRELLAGLILSALTFGQKDMGTLTNGFTEYNNIKHSQKAEKNADLYANKIVYIMYGNNSGALKFFETLKKDEKIPEFLYYFSTHPSTDKRIKYLRAN